MTSRFQLRSLRRKLQSSQLASRPTTDSGEPRSDKKGNLGVNSCKEVITHTYIYIFIRNDIPLSRPLSVYLIKIDILSFSLSVSVYICIKIDIPLFLSLYIFIKIDISLSVFSSKLISLSLFLCVYVHQNRYPSLSLYIFSSKLISLSFFLCVYVHQN